MSAIGFVVRDGAGTVQRGLVGGDGVTSQLIVGSGADVSLNLSNAQILSYAREGGALKITLVDGQVIFIDNFFAPGGAAQADLFLSTNGELAAVELVAGEGGTYYANYVTEDVAGKWSPDDDLYFIGREEPLVAGIPAADEAGMLLAAPLAAGALLIPLLALAGAGAGSVKTDDAELARPTVAILNGTKDTGHVVNEDDHSDGVEIGGTGTPGATVVVMIGDATETTTIDEDGNWDVVFDPTEIPTGTYEIPVKVVVSLRDLEVVVNDILVVDTEATVTFDEDTVGTDGTVNATEEAGGTTLTGTTEAGSTVVVTVNGTSYTATVTGTAWSVQIPAGVLAQGEYDQAVSVLATDQYGNTATTSGSFAVDTELLLTVNAATVEANGIVNAAERSDGVVITGRSDAGATVTVVMGGVTHTAVTDASGNWSVTYAASEVAAGTYNAPIAVSAVDAAGNTSTVNASIRIDTEASVAFSPSAVEGDNTINAAEASDGVVLTGTTEPGSTVLVTFGSQTLLATVAANGSWTVTFPASAVAPGTYDTVAVANAVDANGNAASATLTVHVDTETTVSIRTADVEGDGTINFVERSDGVTLTGRAEAGASVVVTLEGVTRTVTTATNGTWSANFGSADIPSGETTAHVSATATDLAGNTATTTGTVAIDTYVNRLNITSGPVGGDGTINQAEAGQPITIRGVVEEGSTVVVTLAGVRGNAVVAADGSWTVTFPAGSVPSGEYASQIVVSATDRAGNTASITQAVTVDTVAGDVTLSPDPIEIDDVINFVERSDGTLIHGTATPGLTVTVTLGGVAHQVVAAPDGTWSSLFTSAEIPQGTYDAAITASITDSAGNTKTVSDHVGVDTEIAFGLTMPVEGDNIVNFADAANGVQLSGTVEPGSTVVVTYNGTNRAATVAADGTWTLTIPAGAVAAGEYNQSFSAAATDRAGNTASITHQVRVDTLVNELSMGRPVEGDNIINRAEAADGVTLTGRVEAGSTVLVTFEGTERAATVDANGNWRVTYSGAEVPQGDYDATIRIAATDAVGNTRSITEVVAVDTSAPELPTFEFVGTDDRGVRSVATSLTDDDVEIHAISANGTVSTPAYRATTDAEFDEISYRFTSPIPNGSHLVISTEDAAGNRAASLFVLEESLNNTVDIHNAGLSGFNIEEINLQFADDSELTLTAADLEALSAGSNTLTVHGGADDTVTAIGATLSDDTQEIDGRTYRVYDYGHNGGTLIIDEEINVVT